MRVDVADAPTHELVCFNHLHHFKVAGHGRCWEGFQQAQDRGPLAEVPAGQLASHPGVDQHLLIAERS
ncbi:MAG: hypothetical protein WBM08_01915 [Prochlorococcaceae cyanobacterium]